MHDSEWYAVDEACTFLLAWNHHDYAICAGDAVVWIVERDLQ